MAFCKITQQDFDNLIKLSYKIILDGKFEGVKPLMNTVYELVYKAKGNEPQALTFSGLIPNVLMQLASSDSATSKTMRSLDPNIMTVIFELRDNFQDNLAEIKRYLFNEESTLSPQESEELLSKLDAEDDFMKYDVLLKDVGISNFLMQPENEELFSKYNDKYKFLQKEYNDGLIQKREEALALKRGEDLKKKKKEEELQEDDIEDDGIKINKNDFVILDEDIWEPAKELKFHTPMATVMKQIPYDPKAKPDDELALVKNDYDQLMAEFYNTNPLLDQNFSVYLQNDNESLIERRFLIIDELEKALNNIGQVVVIKDSQGKELTMGSAGVVKDKTSPYYNAPIVASVNEFAFNKYIEQRAQAYSRNTGASVEEVLKFYESEKARLAIARGYLEQNLIKEYRVTVIHQSPGVFEMTDEGKVITRFRNGNKTALKSFTVVKEDKTILGTKFKKGQVVAILEGRENQAISVSTPLIGDLTGKIAVQIKDAIDFYLYKEYNSKEEATALVNNFFRKVLYIDNKNNTLQVVYNQVRNVYVIVYTKKSIKKDSVKYIPITLSSISKQRLNIDDALLNTGTLTIPSNSGPIIVESNDYLNMFMENISTRRTAVRDNQGNFHFDRVNPYFSFALEEDLKPGVSLEKVVEVPFIINDIVRDITVHYYSNGRNEYLEYGKLLSTTALSITQRLEILETIKQDETNSKSEAELTPEQNKNINDLKFIEPAYVNYSNEQIQAFIDSKIPDSKVKKIVWHGTAGNPLESIKGSMFWTNEKGNAIGWNIQRSNENDPGIVVPAIVNIKNPFTIKEDGINSRMTSTTTPQGLIKEAKDNNHDGAIWENVEDMAGVETQTVTFEPSQITILNSPETIAEFKEFVGKESSSEEEVEDFNKLMDEPFVKKEVPVIKKIDEPITSVVIPTPTSEVDDLVNKIIIFKLPKRTISITLDKDNPFHGNVKVKNNPLKDAEIKYIVEMLEKREVPTNMVVLPIQGSQFFLLGGIDSDFFQVFDRTLNVAPMRIITKDELEEYNILSKCKK
jgi:hypothetical protein